MQNKFKVHDDSGDRRYFTMIPNYIVNHSTVYEQAIYLYMKRVAGETGTCWTSAQTIAKQLGCSRNTITKYRNKLVKRGWIESIGAKRVGSTKQSVLEYKIIDLWELNMRYYADKNKVSNDDTLQERCQGLPERCQEVSTKVSPVGHKEEPIKKNKEEDVARARNVHPTKMTVSSDTNVIQVTPAQKNRDFFSGGKTINSAKIWLLDQGCTEDVAERELQKFVLYWTEPNKSGTKVRWEQQNTFDVKRRLFTWLSRVNQGSASNKYKVGKV